VQPPPKQNNSNDPDTNEIIKALNSMYLKNIEKKINDEELFKQPPPKEDCPICFLTLPAYITGWRYMSCCGKVLCSGCIHAPVYDNQGNEVVEKKMCPFCRTPNPTSLEEEEIIKRLEKRIEAGDAHAIFNIGVYYRHGRNGFPQDYTKALELFHRAGELRHFEAYTNIGASYNKGNGVEVDMKKAIHYYELSAIGGCVSARFNLGNNEWSVGNWDRVLKHYMIAVRGGHTESLKQIKKIYSNGHATKEDYTKALLSYQEYLSEIKSPQRDEAAETYEDCRYY